MNNKSFKSQLQEMVSDGKTRVVLEDLLTYFQNKKEDELISEVITLESRINLAQRQVGLGLINNQDADVVMNSVTYALTKIIARLEDPPEESEKSPSLTVPKNLLNRIPISNTQFFGRERELEEFAEAFQQYSLIAIEGLGGVGKTEFSLECISQFIPERERIIWVSPITRFDIMIQQSGYGEMLKLDQLDEFQKFKNLESLLDQDNRVLFIEDFHDNKDETYLRFFEQLSIQNSKIIIVTRYLREEIKTGRTIVLEGLGKSAVDYAIDIRNKNRKYEEIKDEDVNKLCELVEGHPLSIELGMQLLSYGESAKGILTTISGGEYNEHKKVEDLTHRLLGDVLENPNTSPKEKDLLMRFSVFRYKVSKEAIEALYDEAKIAFPLSLLQEKLLIRRREALYDSPPLVREFCLARLENASEIHKRAADYFISQRSSNFDIGLEENIIYHLSESQQWEELGKSIEENGRLFLANGQMSILDLIIKALNRNNIDQPVFDVFKAQIYLFENKYKEAEVFARKALAVYDGEGDSGAKALALDVLGVICWMLSKAEDAREAHERSIVVANNVKDSKIEVSALTNLARLQVTLGELEAASVKAYNGLEIAEKTGDGFGKAKVMNLLGKINRLKNNYAKSLEYFNESYIIYSNLGAKINVSTVANNIGGMLYYIGVKNKDYHKIEEALLSFERCLHVERKIGSLMRMGVLHNNIGKIQLNLNMKDEALDNFKKSLELHQKISYDLGVNSAFHGIGLAKAATGEYEEALVYYNKSLESCIKDDYMVGIISVHKAIGKLYVDIPQPNYQLAIEWFIKGLAINTKMKASNKDIIANLDSIKDLCDPAIFNNYIQTAITLLPEDLKNYLPSDLLLQTSVNSKSV